MKTKTFVFITFILTFILIQEASAIRTSEKSTSFLNYLALEPGADVPLIPGPSGTGLKGLYRSLGSSIKSFQDRNEIIEINKNSEKTKETFVSLKQRELDEPGIHIPDPSSLKNSGLSDENKSRIITHSLKIIPEEQPLKNQTAHDALEKPTKRPPILLPSNLTPTPRSGFNHRAPDFYRGIYLNNRTIRKKNIYLPLLQKAKNYGINTLVIDVQPRMPSKEFLNHALRHNFYLVSRVVVFEGGLKDYPPSMKHLKNVADSAENSAKIGFMEVQLDYIRFADKMKGFNLPLDKRYMLISGIIKMITDRLRPYNVRVGADVFGRIAFNQDDVIGQKLEVFSPHLDTIYPMLYPSHFYGDPNRIRNPYKTILDGTKSCMDRIGESTKIIAYIQVFKMSVSASGLSYRDYISAQIKGAADSGGGGYIAWNAGNDYSTLFTAIAGMKRSQPDS